VLDQRRYNVDRPTLKVRPMSATDSPAARIRTVIATCSAVR